jgi:predicted glycoside hydrolase/deacetylase ChbG (UPF0249 family)
MKKIVLCADDYAQDESVTNAILSLLEKERLSAVSCMTDKKNWQDCASKIILYRDNIDIGLHFNLTANESVESLLIKSLSRNINKKEVEEKLNEQIDLFIAGIGCEPDFIDGHQHVHVFPVIRDIFINVLKKRFNQKKPYIRSISRMDFITDIKIKAFILKIVSINFENKLLRNGFEFNKSFSGIYSFDSNPTLYAHMMQKWLLKASDKTIIMCHPGLGDVNDKDPIYKARIHEYNYFMSEQFLQDLKTNNAALSPFKDRFI